MLNKIRKFADGVVKKTVYIYIVILETVCLVGLLGIRPFALSRATSVSAAKKALPIYCVDRDDNKIAISFDAAWGAYRLRRNFTHCV